MTSRLAYSPHPQAPLFAQNNFGLLIDQTIAEISSPNLSTSNENLRQLLRQAGFVNLWFLLKYIAGHAGPFDLLNEDLHLDMCNFRQTQMVPGRKAAGFTSRKFFKTTIFTEGGGIYTLLRNPDACIDLFSCVDTRSTDFFRTIQKFFDSNELVAWLYPEYVPVKGQERWNNTEMVLPNRTKHLTEPSLRGHGVGCSTQGIHSTDILIDDPIGDSQLNSERDSNADMERIRKWLISNINNETLLKNPDVSTVFYTATRYGTNDAHSFIFEDIAATYGHWDNLNYEVSGDPLGWHVYNRSIVENGVLIFPEAMSQEKIDKMKEEDPWTYYTQYENNPAQSGLNELNDYTVKECTLAFDTTWIIEFRFNHELYTVPLNECDVVIACDPGATIGRQTSKTSKSAVVVIARDWRNNIYVARLKQGYKKPSEVFDWTYGFVKLFHTTFRCSVLETQGAFKLLESVWKDYWRVKVEAAKAAGETYYSLKLRGQSKTGDKKAMIRNTLEPILKQGSLYAEKSIHSEVAKAILSFPFGTLDVLDAICLGIRSTIKPLSVQQKQQKRRTDDRFYNEVRNAAGY
jgi:hypothetical protein